MISQSCLKGVVSACELLQQLANDRVIPQMFLKVMPRTGSPHISVITFIALCAALYASAGASLAIVSKMFTLVWLCVMTLFPLSLLLLKFNRGRLPRTSRTPLRIIVCAFGVALAIIGGNIAIDPTTAGQVHFIWYVLSFVYQHSFSFRYFSAYFIAVLFCFSATQNKIRLLRWLYWAYDQNPFLHTWRLTKRFGDKLIKLMTRMKRQPVCILAKTDEVCCSNHLKMLETNSRGLASRSTISSK